MRMFNIYEYIPLCQSRELIKAQDNWEVIWVLLIVLGLQQRVLGDTFWEWNVWVCRLSPPPPISYLLSFFLAISRSLVRRKTLFPKLHIYIYFPSFTPCNHFVCFRNWTCATENDPHLLSNVTSLSSSENHVCKPTSTSNTCCYLKSTFYTAN